MTMITRKGFFTALAAALTAALAKAQTTIITPCRPKLVWEGQVPLCNGQCPQPDCGYRAPGFPKRELHWDEIEKWEQPGVLYWDHHYPNWMVPISRLNRCPRCNTAFWQDPEKE